MSLKFTKDSIVEDVLQMGFSHAGLADVKTLEPLQEVRDMCAEDKCHQYNKNWSCPPGCGTLEECRERMHSYDWGILVQRTMEMGDDFDPDTWRTDGEAHRERLVQLFEELKARYPRVLGLGSAGCRLCAACTYPDAPCRFPERRMSGMEGYGLLVSDVCKKNDLPYYYGKDTVTFTGLFLVKEA